MSNINWNETYLNLSPKLLGICRRYIKDTATAEDIVQDSFIVAIQKENSLKNPNALNGWLSRIVINMAIHHLKETKKINFSVSDDYDLVDNSTLMTTLELDNKSMILASDMDRSDVLEAIDSLPEHHKSVFNMYVIDQFSHNEIAKALAISVGTSKSNLSRARKAIQAYLLEKLNGKTVDEKKKRRIALLLFFGLENRMFANYYQSKFDGFEIKSTKSAPTFSKSISFPAVFTGLNKGIPFAKIAMVSIGFFCILLALYFYNSKPNEPAQNQNNAVFEDLPKGNTVTKASVQTDSKKDTVSYKIAIEKQIAKETISKEKQETQAQKPILKSLEKQIAEAKKDSVKTENPKVVVVKKSIIKKDTVYVTK